MSFNPSVTDRSGEIMARGIMSTGGSITDAITNHQKEAKKLKALQAIAVDALGMDPDEVAKSDAATLQGKVEAITIRNVMGQMKAREQGMGYAAEDQEFERDRNALAKADGDYKAKLPGAVNALMGAPSGSGTNTVPFDLKAFMGDATRRGIRPEDALPIAKMLMEGQQPNLSASFIEDPETGARFMGRGNTTLPSGTNLKNAGQAEAIKDAEGNVIGWGLPSRNGLQPLKTGDVTEKDQFAALTAEKRALLAAKSRVFNDPDGKNWKPFDAAISALDERLKELQAGDKKPAKGGAIKYKLVNGTLQQVTE